jgi:hypothetical protein
LRFAAYIFGATLLLLLSLEGTRIVFTNDEGIILEAAQRMVQGERLYIDFFGYMSPGGYWLQSLVFWAFGFSQPAARAVVLTDFALQAAVLAWLVARFASRTAAIITVLIYIGLLVPQPGLLTAQHRWDSAALGIVSAALIIGGWGALAGVCTAMAAFCTPSVALVAIVTAGWLVFRRDWALLKRYVLGGLGASAGALVILLVSGNLDGFVGQMRWLRDHYSTVNVMPYGSVIGGWAPLFTGHGAEFVIGALLLVGLALPAILPVAVVPWAVWRARREPHLGYLALVTVAFVVSAYPRADVMHLAFFTALPLTLGALLLVRYRMAGYVATGLGVLALLYAAGYTATRLKEQAVASPLGYLRAPITAAPALQGLFKSVRPGASLFVHPYMPVFYYLTQARNPARFSYLAPGMMGPKEEQQALADLQALPPEWVLFLPLTREEFLRVFPNATGLDARFNTIEQWIGKNYEETGITVEGYQLRRRRSGVVTSSLSAY